MHTHYLQHDGWVHPNSLRNQCHVCHWCNLLCVPLQHGTQRRMEERFRQPWRQFGRHHWHAVTPFRATVEPPRWPYAMQTQKSLGWQACLEQDLLQRREVGGRILAKAQLVTPRFTPKGQLLPQGVPCLQISERQRSW